MMYKWTKILPYWIVERTIMRFSNNLQYVKFGSLEPRMCYILRWYDGTVLVRDVEDLKRAKLHKLRQKVEELEYELLKKK